MSLHSPRSWHRHIETLTKPFNFDYHATEVISALLALEKQGRAEMAAVYPYFLSLLYATSAHLIPQDTIATLARLKTALWPIYTAGLEERVVPVLPGNGGETDDETRLPMQVEEPPKAVLKVTTSLLIELKNRSTYAFALANEHLIPDKISIETFARAFQRAERGPVDGPKTDAEKAFFDLMPSATRMGDEPVASTSTSTLTPLAVSRLSANPIVLKPSVPPLPLYAKYLVLAAYCASYNSVKSDMRMFGRGPLTSASGLKGRAGLGLEENGAGYEGGGKVGGKMGQGLKKVKLGKVGKVSDRPVCITGLRAFAEMRKMDVHRSHNTSWDRDRSRSNVCWPSSRRCSSSTVSTHRSTRVTAMMTSTPRADPLKTTNRRTTRFRT